MSNVRWETIVTDTHGVIDYRRVRSAVSVLLAVFAGVSLVAAMAGLIHPGDYVVLGTSALVLPITGAKITDVFRGVNGHATH
jgi:hypothetical protein